MDSLEVTDQQSKAVQKTPNRVALADIEAAIQSESYLSAHDFVHAACVEPSGSGFSMRGETAVPLFVEPLKASTICLMVMRNGFQVIGFSAPADPANFDADLGRKFARENAIRQLWPLMGFSLRYRLAAAGNPI